MDIQLLAIKYFELKEKALVQRAHIDYEMNEQLKALEEDKTSEGKANVAHYKKEIEETEVVFKNTVAAIQPVFEQLFQYLTQAGANKTNPLLVEATGYRLALYLDDNKNIHYKKD